MRTFWPDHLLDWGGQLDDDSVRVTQKGVPIPPRPLGRPVEWEGSGVYRSRDCLVEVIDLDVDLERCRRFRRLVPPKLAREVTRGEVGFHDTYGQGTDP